MKFGRMKFESYGVFRKCVRADHGSDPQSPGYGCLNTNPADRLSARAAHECVSEEALVHLKSYKYSGVDKSLISKYVLKHYVRSHPSFKQSSNYANKH